MLTQELREQSNYIVNKKYNDVYDLIKEFGTDIQTCYDNLRYYNRKNKFKHITKHDFNENDTDFKGDLNTKSNLIDNFLLDFQHYVLHPTFHQLFDKYKGTENKFEDKGDNELKTEVDCCKRFKSDVGKCCLHLEFIITKAEILTDNPTRKLDGIPETKSGLDTLKSIKNEEKSKIDSWKTDHLQSKLQQYNNICGSAEDDKYTEATLKDRFKDATTAADWLDALYQAKLLQRDFQVDFNKDSIINRFGIDKHATAKVQCEEDYKRYQAEFQKLQSKQGIDELLDHYKEKNAVPDKTLKQLFVDKNGSCFETFKLLVVDKYNDVFSYKEDKKKPEEITDKNVIEDMHTELQTIGERISKFDQNNTFKSKLDNSKITAVEKDEMYRKFEDAQEATNYLELYEELKNYKKINEVDFDWKNKYIEFKRQNKKIEDLKKYLTNVNNTAYDGEFNKLLDERNNECDNIITKADIISNTETYPNAFEATIKLIEDLYKTKYKAEFQKTIPTDIILEKVEYNV